MQWRDGSDQSLSCSIRPWWWYPPYWQHPQREILRDITGHPYPYVPVYCGNISLLGTIVTRINGLYSWSFTITGTDSEWNARALLKYALANWNFDNED